MRPSAYLIPLVLLLTACPPKDEETETEDSGAERGTTGAQGPVEPEPQTAKPGPAKPEPSMERGLASPKGEAEKAK